MKVLLIPLVIIWVILVIVYTVLDKPYVYEPTKEIKVLEYVMFILAVIIIIVMLV
jgi:hypothetical protein